jgi:hypothetical protein
LVKDHSAEHSYYIEHFVIEYVSRVMVRLGQEGKANAQVGEMV